MEKKRKFSKANLLYVFSMLLGLTIIVAGFSVANNARKEMSEQMQISEKKVEIPQTETVSKPAEKIEKKSEKVDTVVLTTAEQEPKEDEFAPKLENYLITPPTKGEISRTYTGKSLVYSEYFDDWRVKKGVDISATELAQVRAAANGRVKSVYKDNSLGTIIVLEHGDFNTVYGNLSTDGIVSVGDEVRAGDVISGVGKAPDGKTYLHFEIEYAGEDIDPEPLIVR